MDAATRHREAAKAIGEHGDELLVQFVFLGKGLAAIARGLAVAETPGPGADARKTERKDYEGKVTRRAQLYTQRLVRELVTTIKTLSDFYASKSTEKRQNSWWRPVDPETGRTVLRSRYGSIQKPESKNAV